MYTLDCPRCMQLCTREKTYLFQLCKMHPDGGYTGRGDPLLRFQQCLEPLRDLIESDDYVKCGVGTPSDCARFKKVWPQLKTGYVVFLLPTLAIAGD